MQQEENIDKIAKKRKEWESGTLKESLDRFGIEQSPNKFYTPEDIKDHDFLKDVGFPGEYPYTAGAYPTSVPGSGPATGGAISGGGLVRSGGYSGYGIAEDTRDFYKREMVRGRRGGPNLAFDLPTQIGLDSDNPRSRGEVGRTGVVIDTLADFEIIYEAFQAEQDLDKIASSWTINAPANVILAMYVVLAEKRGIPLNKLRCSPQNDILKEFIARGTYIFPPKPSLRMIRDTMTFCLKNIPMANLINIGGYHIREAGATRAQTLAFTLSNTIAYVQTGINAGLEPDTVIPRLVLYSMSGSMELLKEIALKRACRRMWAKIMKERFGAKSPKSLRMREAGGGINGYWTATAQRPLNNLTRAALGGFAAALAGSIPTVMPAYDESLGLGWSTEGMQLSEDASRIIQYEVKATEVIDPFAGSYYMEAITDEIEKEACEIIKKIDEMGGAVAAIESGYMQRCIAQSCLEYQKRFEAGQEIVVGVNSFTGEQEIEVLPNRVVPYPYDPNKLAEAESRQLEKLARVKNERDEHQVITALDRLRESVRDDEVNLIYPLIEAVKAYATIGEMCGTLKEIFGEYRPSSRL
ncbi:methylmalonyl-CoA mutase family protein [Chloroflexota bacterium]